MPVFGQESQTKLAGCDVRLQQLFNEVIKTFDCKVTEGHRGQEAQDRAFAEGRSKLKYPNGKHNAVPSKAIDVYPYPIDMKDIKRFYYFAGFVMGVAAKMGLKIRYGGDWDKDYQVNDQTFNDLVHFEVK